MIGPVWRLLDSGALDGAEQMALDSGLMDRARQTGETVLRVYRWTRPTLSFGRHEAIAGHFDRARLAAEGVDAVRRPTGGRVLLHDREVTYSVTAPVADDESLRTSYARINALLVSALRAIGARVEPAAKSVARRPGGAPCFAEPALGELVFDGRKLVGSAQVRDRGALLQHGSILLGDDQARILTLASALASGPLVPPAPAATLSEAADLDLGYDDVRDALFAAAAGAAPGASPIDPVEAARFAETHRAHYASIEWTWRA
jgi:lipoate-protein ligase A